MPILPFNVTKIHQLRGELRLNLQKLEPAVGFFDIISTVITFSNRWKVNPGHDNW